MLNELERLRAELESLRYKIRDVQREIAALNSDKKNMEIDLKSLNAELAEQKDNPTNMDGESYSIIIADLRRKILSLESRLSEIGS